MLLCAAVERFGVSRMRDFFILSLVTLAMWIPLNDLASGVSPSDLSRWVSPSDLASIVPPSNLASRWFPRPVEIGV